MIELGNRPVAVVQAAPFGFGPVSTSLAIADHLRRAGVAIVWLADGVALELLELAAAHDYIVPCSGSADEVRAVAHLLEEADVVVVNTDPDFADLALAYNRNLVYVDILYWMWEVLPDVATKARVYIYEDFDRVDTQLARLKPPPGAVRVGPLVLPAPMEREETGTPTLLVSLGGVHRPGYASRDALDRYRDMVLSSLLEVLETRPVFDTVYVCGGGIEPGHRHVGETRIVLGPMATEAYRDVLHRATAAILTPGLTGFYEVALARTPCFFLPPHNYSQYLQLETFEQWLPTVQYADWRSLGINQELPPNLDEAAMLIEVDRILGTVVERRRELADALARFIDAGLNECDQDPLHAAATSIVARNEGGADVAAAHVLDGLPELPALTRAVPASADADIPVPSLPSRLTLEVFGGCQLRCPLCPTGQRLPGRPHGAIDLALVDRILDELGDHLSSVDLFSWGEPFLHPQVLDIISRFAQRGIHVRVSSNLQKMPDAAALIASGLSELIVSCHGVSQPIYEKYMVGGSVDRTLANVHHLLEALRPEDPLSIVLRYVVFAHNESELEEMQRLFAGSRVKVEAAPMRVDMRREILQPASENIERDRQWIPVTSRFYDTECAATTRAPLGCNLTFEEIAIDVDGTVYPCASVYDRADGYGNITSTTIADVWKSEPYRQARMVVMPGCPDPDTSVVCKRCKASGFRDF